MSLLKNPRKLLALILIGLCFFSDFFTYHFARAYGSCSPISLLYLRGSSGSKSDFKKSNNDFDGEFEKSQQTAAFLRREIRNNTASWIDVEFKNLVDEPGIGVVGGYPAVGISSNMVPNANALEAEWSATGSLGGEYRQSVGSGVAELTAFLEKRVIDCPLQQIVLAGYSQGAQVVGEALFRISKAAKDHVVYVALFGDPKFNPGTSADRLLAGYEAPWVRGNIRWYHGGGVLDKREPYIPEDMYGKVGSWCDKQDFICAGGGIPSNVLYTLLNNGHNSYDVDWAPQAESEIMRRLETQLKPLGYAGSFVQPEWLPAGANAQAADIMLLIDTTGSMGSVIQDVRAKAPELVNQLATAYPNARFGLAEFRDLGSEFVARTDTELTENKDVVSYYVQQLKVGEGGDEPEDWFSGIEEALRQKWRCEATKKVFIFADTKPHDPDTYNHMSYSDITAKARSICGGVELITVLNSPFIKPEFAADYQAAGARLAAGTGGEVLVTKSATYGGDTVGAYKELLGRSAKSPVAKIDGKTTGKTGEIIGFSALDSYDPNSTIVKYSYDFNNDGVPDVVSSNPNANWHYDAPYDGKVTVTVESSDGGKAGTSIDVHIEAPPAAKPVEAPAAISAPEPLATPGEVAREVVAPLPLVASSVVTPPQVKVEAVGVRSVVVEYVNYQKPALVPPISFDATPVEATRFVADGKGGVTAVKATTTAQIDLDDPAHTALLWWCGGNGVLLLLCIIWYRRKKDPVYRGQQYGM